MNELEKAARTVILAIHNYSGYFDCTDDCREAIEQLEALLPPIYACKKCGNKDIWYWSDAYIERKHGWQAWCDCGNKTGVHDTMYEAIEALAEVRDEHSNNT